MNKKRIQEYMKASKISLGKSNMELPPAESNYEIGSTGINTF